ncbi:MAG: preprotein translocase subunit SecG [Putridiphycobacter sp.]
MTLLLILIIVVSVALVLFVLIQNPKGGGINSEFGSATQLGGAKRATDILEKGSWGLGIALAVLCLLVAPNYKSLSGGGTGDDTEIKVNSDQATSDDATVNMPGAEMPQ